MDDRKKLYVPRPAEVAEFERWVGHEPATGDIRRAALVIGPAGMGKSTLLGMFENLCTVHSPEPWYCQRVSLNANESASSFLERLLGDIHKLLRGTYLRTGPNDERIKKELLKLVPKAGNLLALLVKEDKRPGWERFVDYLSAVSKALEKQNGRFVLLIDPDRAMQDGQAEDWHSIAKRVPARTRIVIAQRPDDVIATDAESKLTFARLPESGSLSELDEPGVQTLYENEFNMGRLRRLATDWPADIRETLPRAAYRHYTGHPFAHDAVIRLLESKEGEITDPAAAIATWPRDVEALMDMLYASLTKLGDEAVRAALALQVYAIPTPFDKWVQASGLDELALANLLDNPRYRHYFENVEPNTWKPFHQLFAEHLERELCRLNDTRKELVDAAWKTIEPQIDKKRISTGVPDMFSLLAATNVAFRFTGATFILDAVDQIAITKSRLGLLDDALADYGRMLAQLGEHESIRAYADVGIGNVLMMRGDLDGAMRRYGSALEIERQAGRLTGVASCFGNIATILGTQRKWPEAEKMIRLALTIEIQIGRRNGIANAYGNLGIALLGQEKLADAESMLLKAIEIDRETPRLENLANHYGNLGNIHEARDEPDDAMRMHNQSLALNEQLGNVEGIAANHGNLGRVSQARGDNAGAREHWAHALTGYEMLGATHMVEKTQRLIDSLRD